MDSPPDQAQPPVPMPAGAGAGAGAGAEEDAARSGKQKSGMYARFSSESMGADERDASGNIQETLN